MIYMMKLLIKLFIKDYKDVKNPAVRNKYGLLAGVTGIVSNLLLFAGKFAAGALSSSIAIIADAFNNLSDAGASIVTLVGFKVAGMPADSDHPFGHGRVEYLAGLVVSVIIMLMGIELGKSSVDKIINPEQADFSVLSIAILVCSVLVKLWMSLYNRKIGKLIDSAAMRATAADSLSDVIATASVIVGIVISMLTGLNLDGYIGVLVAIFIFIAGLRTVKESLTPLLGERPDAELVEDIKKTVMSYDGVIGLHDLIVHNYGVGVNFISLHAEVPYSMGFMEAHEIIDVIENDLKEKYRCVASIHMDPIQDDDETVLKYKEFAERAVKEIDPILTIHDFRMTDGVNNKNLLFDIVVPHKFVLSDQQVKELVSAAIIKEDHTLNPVISIDKMMS